MGKNRECRGPGNKAKENKTKKIPDLERTQEKQMAPGERTTELCLGRNTK